jgi:hypothetical protein
MTSRTEQGDRRAGSLLGRPREGLCSRLDDTTARTKASGLGRTNPTSGLNKEPRSEMMSMTDRTPQDDRGASSSSRQPNKNGSMLITQHDREMASRQTRIDSLPPDQRKEQETWAQKQLKGLSAMCPYGCQWKRSKTYGGYLCAAKLCLVTDELLAEGKGGWYTLHYGPEGLSNKNPKRQGPHYSK